MDNTQGTVLLVEDDTSIRRGLRATLTALQFEIGEASTGEEALMRLRMVDYDAVLMDLNMPGIGGVEACRRARREFPQISILVVTVRDNEEDKVEALDAGADDYITKPFAMRELIARVKAVLRRFERPTAPSVISFEEVIIDASAMQLKVRGELTTTTATEFRLLDYLARHPGRVFSRDHLLDAVWGDARFVTPRSVDVYVRRIREKIESDPENPRYLKTVRGAGYRFEVPKAS
jgi:two-component system phosphate regulon response regulator PhoB